MSTPVLHLLAGPNGSGKTTFVDRVLRPVTHLPFVNADVIATEQWPGKELAHTYEAAREAAQRRAHYLRDRRSFIAETVFSHPSKVDLVEQATALGYVVQLHAVMVPLAVTQARVQERVRRGGHAVPQEKVSARYERLWPLVAEARRTADRTTFYDNSVAKTPFSRVATYERGVLVGLAVWPIWTPAPLLG